jgi:ribosomal protein S12 methylthiotransferase accessory factor
MQKVIDVSFPGGKKVAAAIGGHTILTDQPADDGGEGAAPAPFALFLVSLATCAGYYALQFCLSRGIPTGGMSLKTACTFDEQARRYVSVEFSLSLPPGFPEKYREAIVRAMDSCAVKKHILNPPKFTVKAEARGEQ